MAGCKDDDADSGPIQIALLAPQTGALQFVGESFERVAEVAVANINDNGGIDGRDLELQVADTATDPATAAAELQTLIDNGVVAVVGPATSGEVGMAYPVARDNEVPIISPSSTAPSLSLSDLDDDGYMFRNVPDDNIQGVAMAHYLYNLAEPQVQSVAVLFEATDYGTGLKDAFKVAFENLGGTVPAGYEIDFSQNLADGAAAEVAIQELAALDPAPTMVVMVALEQDAVKLVQAWDNSGGTPDIPGMQFFMTDGARSTGFLDSAPASVRTMCGTAPTFPVTGLAYGALADAYAAANDGADIGQEVFGPNVWDAFHLFGAAMLQQSHDFRSEPVGGQHLRDALTEISKDGQQRNAGDWRNIVLDIRAGNDIDYDGAAGPNDFSPIGQAVGPYEVWCISADGSTFEQELFLDAADIQAL